MTRQRLAAIFLRIQQTTDSNSLAKHQFVSISDPDI